MTTLLKNGILIDPSNNVNGRFDVLVADGRVAEIAENIITHADKIIDCTGLTLMPGLFDMHVHFRDPGQTHKEDLSSGAAAAAAGGVTAVLCMPNTTPVIDEPELVAEICERARSLPIDLHFCAAITKGLQGKELTDFEALSKAGAIAFSDDGMPVADAELMSIAMEKCADLSCPIISHCEDFSAPDTRTSENIITQRELRLAKEQDVWVHIAHVSTKEAVEAVRSAKAEGVKVTCEATPHHFGMAELELFQHHADYKMNPPLRTADDVEAVVAGLIDGTIDCIASDHAPHSVEEKADFDTAPNGVIGLETMLAVTLTKLYHTERLSLNRIVRLMCVNPRDTLHIRGGSLGVGDVADIAVVDLNEKWVVDPDKLHSKSKNTCFKGHTLKGKVKYTLVKGSIVYSSV